MRSRPMAGRLTAALIVSVGLLLSACGRRGSSAGDASKPIDLKGPMTLYAAASQARFDGRQDDAEAIEHFERRKHALEYLGEPVPPVQTIGDILASERTAIEPLDSVEERLTSGISTFDFRWRDRVNEQTIIEDPGRARSHTNLLGEHGIEGSREVRPGIWWVPWTQIGHRADGYIVRAIATTHRMGEWTLSRHYVLHDSNGPDIAFSCDTTPSELGQSMWVYCDVIHVPADPPRDSALLDRLTRFQSGGEQPALVGSDLVVYEHYHGAITAEIKSGDYAAQEAKAQEFQKSRNASASVKWQLRRAWWIVSFWGFPLGLFGIPMVGAWILFRRRGGSTRGAIGRAVWAALAVMLGVVTWNCAFLAHPGRSYPDAWGPAGLFDYVLIFVAVVAGIGGLMAVWRALRQPR